MFTYICMYRGKKLTLDATSSFDAQVRAAEIFNARNAWDVIVALADTPISTASL